MPNPVFDAVRTVLAVREYQDKGVADDVVRRVAEAGRLTAWDEGLGSNWTGFGGLTEVARELGIPDRYDVLAVLPFGYPARRLGKGKKNRKPLGEAVSSERFGQPFG